MPLTPDAKAELAEAIRIVREDKFERFARSVMGKRVEPVPDPLIDPENDPTPTPPEKDPEKKDPEVKVKRSAWWGELMDEE